MHLLFCINRKFCWMLLQCLRSIIRFPCASGYTAHILHSDLTEADFAALRQAIPDVTISEAKIDEAFFQDFPETHRYPKQIYYRIFAARFLPDSLERVLYLDTDTIVIQPLEELYQMDFQGASYIACTHVRKVFRKVNCHRLGVTEDVPYPNTGVMLLNLQSLRQQQTADEVLEFVNQHKNRLLLPDQDILTALYGEQIQLIDSYRYNLSDRILALYNARHPKAVRDLNWVRENTCIIHYCGRNKPWKPGYHGILYVFYEELLQ